MDNDNKLVCALAYRCLDLDLDVYRLRICIDLRDR